MLHSKLLLSVLRQYNTCRTVVAKQPADSPPPTTTRAALHERGIHVGEAAWQLLALGEERLPSHACMHLFSVEEELARVPRKMASCINFSRICRAVYFRGRRPHIHEVLAALWHSRLLFGDRLTIFPLPESLRDEETLYSFLAWRPSGSSGTGELLLVPRRYLFTGDTWVGYCER